MSYRPWMMTKGSKPQIYSPLSSSVRLDDFLFKRGYLPLMSRSVSVYSLDEVAPEKRGLSVV